MVQEKETQKTSEERPTRITYDEFAHVDDTFREKFEKIVAELTEVLANNDLTGYRVIQVSFQPPNPPGCRPYCKWVPGSGPFGGHIECGISCFD